MAEALDQVRCGIVLFMLACMIDITVGMLLMGEYKTVSNSFVFLILHLIFGNGLCNVINVL